MSVVCSVFVLLCIVYTVRCFLFFPHHHRLFFPFKYFSTQLDTVLVGAGKMALSLISASYQCHILIQVDVGGLSFTSQ